jgi:diguanylate cyclase (GGDEF)-like protein
MSPRRDSSEVAVSLPDDVALMSVQGGPLAALIDVAADAGPRELLEAATRGITGLLGERGSCILLDGQPRVTLALHRPTLHDLPIDLDRYPEVRAAAERGDVVVVEDAQRDARLATVRELLPPHLHGVVAVPLVAGQRCLGVVLVQSGRARRPDDSARATATLLARLAALLLLRHPERDAVVQPAAPMDSAPVAAEAPALDRSRILVVEDDTETALALTETLRDEGYRVDRAADGPECLRKALEKSPDLVLLDVNLPGMSGFDTAAFLRRATSTRDIPILFLSGMDGLPARVRDERLEQVDFMPKPFTLDELLARIQLSIGEGRDRETLKRAAEQDELTGLGNLRLLRQRLLTERARFSRYGHALSIAMIDVDKLKMINDERGHVAGSNALKAIAAVLRRQARDTDLVVRYGGDEFVALLPHTGLAEAQTFGRRVLAELAGLDAEGLPITVSVGVAAMTNPRSRETHEQLLARADRAAYRAKEAGGNQIAVDEDEPR